jgi:hypothetical protein
VDPPVAFDGRGTRQLRLRAPAVCLPGQRAVALIG